MGPLPPVDINLIVHRLATAEAVSLQSRLALVALLRGESENEIAERLAVEEMRPSQHVIDKKA